MDSDDDGFLEDSGGEPLETDYQRPSAPVAQGEVKYETDSTPAARPSRIPDLMQERKSTCSQFSRSPSHTSGSKDSTARAFSRNNSSPDQGDIEAKNIVIAGLEKRLRDCKCQRMSSEPRDNFASPINTSGEQPRFLGRSASGLSNNSSQQYNSEMETSNSTDAEKLANSETSVLELALERDKLHEKLIKADDTILKLTEKLEVQEKMRQQTLDLRQDTQKMYAELEGNYDALKSKYAEQGQQLENSSMECVQLRDQLEEERKKLMIAETKLSEQQHNALSFMGKDKGAERQLEIAQKRIEQLENTIDTSSSEALSAASSHSSKEISLLNNTVELLCKELKETAVTVKRQNETIRRLKQRAAAARGLGKEMSASVKEERSIQSFRSRGHSNSPPLQSSLHLNQLAESSSANVPSIEARNIPTNVKSQQGKFYATTDPSDEDLYGASSPVNFQQHYRTTGPFDLDSYEDSLKLGNRVPRPQPTMSQSQRQGNFPMQVSSRVQPTYRPSSSYSQPLPPASQTPLVRSTSSTHPVYPPVLRPAEQSDGDSDEKRCPVCNQQQPRGTTMDEFQSHVMMCLARDDDSPPNSGTRNDSSDTICPVCSCLFPPGTPQQEVQSHVNAHFDQDNSLVDRVPDNFATPRNA